MKAKLISLFVLLMLLSVTSLCSAVSYDIVDLGLGYGYYARAMAVNEAGVTAGYYIGDSGIAQAASWDTDGACCDVGDSVSRAYAVNDLGQIVGWASVEGDSGSVSSHAFVYDGLAVTDLGTLGGAASHAWDINNSSQVVGWAQTESGNNHAVLWAGDNPVDLGTLGGSSSIAYSINSTGCIVGSSQDSTGVNRAFRWIDGLMSALGDPDDVAWTAASAVNDQMDVLVWGGFSGGATSSYIWQDGEYIDLGNLGGDETWGYGMNNLGQCVGWSELVDGTYEAFLSDGTDMISLGTLGGSFSAAYDINDQGIIAGRAQDELGYTHAVLWVPVPEPATFALLAVCWPLLSRKRR